MLAQTARGQLGAPSFRVLCERGKPSHVARTLLSARSHSRRCRRERPRSCSPYHCHPGGSGVLRSRRTPDEGPTHFRATPHAPAKFGGEQAGNGTILVLEPALSEAEGCRTASLSHRHSEWLQPRGICC